MSKKSKELKHLLEDQGFTDVEIIQNHGGWHFTADQMNEKLTLGQTFGVAKQVVKSGLIKQKVFNLTNPDVSDTLEQDQ